MFLTKRRAILIGVIASIAAAIIFTPLILTITLPPNVEEVKINLEKVETVIPPPEEEEEASNLLALNVAFNVHNPTDKTLTTSRINYTLSANGASLGKGEVDYVDIPVHGRPQLLSGGEATITSEIKIPRNEPNLEQINIGNHSSSDINWEVEGTADIESGFATTTIAFKDELELYS